MEEKGYLKSHRVNIDNRKNGIITGIKSVISCDEEEIVLATEYGNLFIKGKEMHVNRLDVDKGEVELNGVIDSFEYHDNVKNASSKLIKRMFK